MIATKPAKALYTETEAAQELGVTVEQLRTLIRQHVASTEEECANVAGASYQRADLLLLKFLSRQPAFAASRPPF